MFEAIKELMGSDLNLDLIVGFEPLWWGFVYVDVAEEQPVQHKDSLYRRVERIKRNDLEIKSEIYSIIV
ncbi:DEAD/DEAH box helicase, partial [Neisseria sp. P0014.S006]